ncbi:MAG: TolC family protein [Bacteroidaceae bacterium]|nr:TolC family protein [Bacteroidaceae bacterium]
MASAKTWTLQECIDYALANNISLRQAQIKTQQSHEDVLQSRSALFPSVSFSTNQNMNYRPFSESTIDLTNGSMTTSSKKWTYNGSYGINANWTVWNGNKNRMTIKQNRLTEQTNELSEEQQANTIQEKIAQLYVQILYETEAVHVNEEIVKASQLQADRAKAMVEVGSLARVDQVQLEAQVDKDKYSLVNAQSQLANYKLQLKQLLELHDDEDFEVAIPSVTDSEVLSLIPEKSAVYASALQTRPEIKQGQLSIEAADLSIRSARTGYMPTLSLRASIGSSNSSGQQTGFGTQIKTNLSNALGLTLSVPIFDNLSTRTAIRKAKFTKQTNELALQDKQKTLYSSIEKYWLDATTSQQQYVYAKKNKESMQESYRLVSEQFNCGLKNIVELTTGKNNLLQAEQQVLQTKYTALLNQALLKFYAGENLSF